VNSDSSSLESIAVDAHVHIHPCFDLDGFLDRAAENLTGSGSTTEHGGPCGMLLLTESSGQQVFRRLREGTEGAGGGRWIFHPTGEPCSLSARDPAGREMVLVGGRQVATAERLEVLALGCDAGFEDGRDLRSTLRAVRGAGALPVVPWGFGKWWFGRGRIVAALIDDEEPADFFLGDNSGRPALGRRHPLFDRASRRGIRVLPGSDPLPFAGQERKVGRFGLRVFGRPDPDRPAEWLKDRLRRSQVRIESYGRGENLGAFVRDQIVLRLRKRSRVAA